MVLDSGPEIEKEWVRVRKYREHPPWDLPKKIGANRGAQMSDLLPGWSVM